VLGAALAVLMAAAPGPAPYARWAAVVIAGDDEAAHAAIHTEAFDNARRDVVAALERKGFAAANIAQFSAEPARHPEAQPAELGRISHASVRLARQAPDGCLVYLTSHGSPAGAVLGAGGVTPAALARVVGQACGKRPTVAVVSACFSGVFVPALAGPDRLVLTAARRDRSSFGCGESDRYPFFDGCVLAALPTAPSFQAVAVRARRCVAARERAEGMSPPSEPQTFAGPRFHAPPLPPG
jgi:hypothetical protein